MAHWGFQEGRVSQFILPGNPFPPGASSSFPLTLEMLAYEIKCKVPKLNLINFS